MVASEHFSRKKELGQFLRARREATTPSATLLQLHAKRRTPGLRRDEVAEAAGVGISWYTWLEQGRDIRVSGEILRRVSRALELDAHEIAHLYRLAGLGVPEVDPPLPTSVKPSLQRVLDSFENAPAYVHNARWDRIGWNEASLALMGDFSNDPVEERNTVWRTFLNPVVREYTLDWDNLARVVVSEFNASFGRQFEDPWLKEFVDQLSSKSPQFLELWQHRGVIPRREERTRIHHKAAGVLYLERSVFEIPDEESLSLVVFTPLNEQGSVERLRDLIHAFRVSRQPIAF